MMYKYNLTADYRIYACIVRTHTDIFVRLARWRMFIGNNIVITIIHRFSDLDNLLFYHYYFILIIILLYNSRDRHVWKNVRLWHKYKTVLIPIWCPPVGTSDHIRIYVHIYVYAYMYTYACTKRWLCSYIFKLLSIYYHRIVKLSFVQPDKRIIIVTVAEYEQPR